MQPFSRATSLIPDFLQEQYRELLGSEYDEFLNSLEQPAVRSVRWNKGKLKKYGTVSYPESTHNQLPWGERSYYVDDPKPSIDPMWYAGRYYVQEPSSQVVTQFIDQMQGVKVLDLCAAPGGKTTLVLDHVDEDSLVVANEVVSKRARILKQNLVSWGKLNVVLTQNQAGDFGRMGEYFDYILVDAPCSGEGLCRRDPYVFNTITERTVWGHVQRQNLLLDEISQSLAVGGIMIYSTCTFTPDEDELVVANFLDTHAEFELVIKNELKDFGFVERESGMYRAYPHKVKGEGFFVCGLKKVSSSVSSQSLTSNISERHLKNLSRSEQEEVEKLVSGDFVFEKIGDIVKAYPTQLYNEIADIESRFTTHLSGITLGKFQQKGFLPSQDLALSLHFNIDSMPTVEIPADALIQYYQRGLLPETQKNNTSNEVWTHMGIPHRFRKQVK
jgi:16S rRNA C967 or C1407 C5-methylase (RsmB/RsmF family)